MTRFTRPGAVIAALALAGATALAACGKSSNASPSVNLSGGYGTVPPPASGTQRAGTVTWAESPGSAPTWILPIITSAAFTVYSTNQFSYELFRPLYWMSNGVQPTETPAMSLANAPKWSHGTKTVTVTLKTNYKWSDGQPVTSRDVLFFFDEIKAAIKEDSSNWGPYTPNLGIPDQVASVTTPSAKTVVFTLNKPVNPQWFWYNQLSNVLPMPSHAWARASSGGPALDFTVPANAKKIWDYLNKQAKSLSTYTSNPLWQTVDGPYKLTKFNNTTGAFTMTPNPAYGGPRAKKMSTLEAVPYTSDAAEFNAVKAGSIDVGYLPLSDIKQAGAVKAGGYNLFGYPDWGFNYVTYNFLDKTGHFNKIIAQLYFRQAFAHLENEQGYIKAFFGGAGAPAYGPVPSIPKSPYTPANAVKNPYPFSVPTTIKILKSHGWHVVPGGTTTCAKPGTGVGQCGAGIPAGTKLSFNLIYTTSPDYIGEEVTDLASQAAKAGIQIHLQSSNFNYIVTNYDNPIPSGKPYINKWAMEDFGGYTNNTYPTQLSIFSPGVLNEGTYNNPEATRLIHASVTSGDPAAVKAEAAFLTKDQPSLFQPNPDYVTVWKKTLSGPQASFANQTQFWLTPEFWYFTKPGK
jgi:peptide/nickel transport system substrate-binding protein